MQPAIRIACGLMLLVAPALAAAQSEVFDRVPQEALGIVVVNRLGTSSAKIERLAQELQLPFAAPLATAQAITGAREGIDDSKPAGLCVLKAPDGQPKPIGILLVPVTDYQKFVAQFQPADAAARVAEVQVAGAQALVAEKNGYAAFALATDKAPLESFLDNKTSIAGALRPLTTWLKSQDIAGIITRAGVRQMATQVAAQMAATTEQLGKLGGQQAAAAALEQYQKVVDLAQREVTLLGLGLRIDDGMALHLTTRMLVAKGGSLSQLLADVKGRNDLLARLPDGPFVMAGGAIVPASWFDKFSGLIAQFSQLNPGMVQGDGTQNADAGKAMAEVMKKSMQGVNGFSTVMGATKPDEALYAQTVGLMFVDDSSEFLKRYPQTLEELNEVVKKSGVQAPLYQTKAITVDGREGLEVSGDFTATAKGGPNAEAMKQLMEKMFGPGGKTNIYVAAADKNAVIMAYVSQDNLKRALKAYEANNGGLSASSQVRITSKLLPKNYHWVFYVVPRHGVAWVKTLMQSTLGGQVPFQIPDFPETPPVGATVTFFPVGIAGELVVPIEVTKAVGSYVMQFQKPSGNEPNAEAEQP